MDERTCQLCSGPISKRNTSGYCSQNPECKRKAQAVADARWHAAHPERSAARTRAWSLKNPERRRAINAKADSDPARHARKLLGNKRWKADPANADRVREYNRRGRQNYLARADRPCLFPGGCSQRAEVGLKYCRPHTNAENRRLYRQRAGRLKSRLAKAQEWQCPWCGEPLPSSLSGTHVDHIIPRSSGLVIEDEWNLQLLHRACNMAKFDKVTPQAIALAAAHGLVL